VDLHEQGEMEAMKKKIKYRRRRLTSVRPRQALENAEFQGLSRGVPQTQGLRLSGHGQVSVSSFFLFPHPSDRVKNDQTE
jgi:hypothetical protein